MKKGVLMVVTVIVVFLSGCTGYPRGVEPPREMNYRTGSQGLELRFPADTPTRLYENDEARFLVEIRNRGAFPQFDEMGEFNGFLWVGGYDNSVIELIPQEGHRQLDGNALEGKSEVNVEGGYSGVVIEGRTFSLPQGTPYYRTPIIVTATYWYKTIATSTVCIDPNPRSPDVREKVCRISDYGSVALSGSQGAPVAITNVEEDVTANNLLFKIYVQNVGGGMIIDENNIDNDPNQGYEWDSLDWVYIKDVSVGNIHLDEAGQCRPDIGEYLKLINGRGYIFCKMSTASIGTVYKAPLNIQLQYAYANSIQRDIEVFRELNY